MSWGGRDACYPCWSDSLIHSPPSTEHLFWAGLCRVPGAGESKTGKCLPHLDKDVLGPMIMQGTEREISKVIMVREGRS